MQRNGSKPTPKDLIAELAAREDGVARVHGHISGIAGPARGAAALVPNPQVCCEICFTFVPARAEPVAAFRVCAGGSLKTKIEEWKVPYSYTSGPRNLLQRHFRKVTAGSWFEGGAVIVLKPVAESVERTWGLEQKQPHPKWGGVVWHA
jgi:hypothetical protein